MTSELYRRVDEVFGAAPFIQSIGYRLVEVGEGWLLTELQVADWHRQQHGYVHAGVLGTMVDHSQGGAASTVIPAGHSVLTAEYKINLLRPAMGRVLRCRAEVVRSGRTLVVTRADVHQGETVVATSLATMAVVARTFQGGAGGG
jgi:uncharacterized protein (TIGR00369 family)